MPPLAQQQQLQQPRPDGYQQTMPMRVLLGSHGEDGSWPAPPGDAEGPAQLAAAARHRKQAHPAREVLPAAAAAANGGFTERRLSSLHGFSAAATPPAAAAAVGGAATPGLAATPSAGEGYHPDSPSSAGARFVGVQRIAGSKMASKQWIPRPTGAWVGGWVGGWQLA